jgi:hypothetical protein
LLRLKLILLWTILFPTHLAASFRLVPLETRTRRRGNRSPIDVLDVRPKKNAQYIMSIRSDTNRGTTDILKRPQRQKIRVLGVCGGIGSGKSSACRILVSELGCAAHIGTFEAKGKRSFFHFHISA